MAMLPVAIGFAAIGVWLLGEPGVPPWIAWITIAFFSLCAVMIAVTSLRPTELHLDREGFTISPLVGKTVRERWADVDDFGVRKLGKGKQLLFRYTRDNRSAAEGLGPALTGNQGALPGLYAGLSRAELADIMQRYRDAALR